MTAVRGPDDRLAANVYDRSESGRRLRSRTVIRDGAEHDDAEHGDDSVSGVDAR